MQTRIALLACLLAIAAVCGPTLVVPAHAALIRGQRVWTSQGPGPASTVFHAVSCPTAPACYAAGDGGTVLATTDGGNNWSATASAGTTGLWSISCADVKNCTAVGLHGTIVRTSDGGASWATILSGTTQDLFGVSCPSTTQCVAVGGFTTVLMISGTTVHPANANAPYTVNGVSCASPTTCYLVGWTDAFTRNGAIQVSTDGGMNWQSQQSNDPSNIDAISCTPGTTACAAVDDTGALLSTTDGSTWSMRQLVTSWLTAVSCPAAGTCLVAAKGGVILSTANGGASWQRVGDLTGNDLFGVSCRTLSKCTVVGDSGTILSTADFWPPDPSPTRTQSVTPPSKTFCPPPPSPVPCPPTFAAPLSFHAGSTTTSAGLAATTQSAPQFVSIEIKLALFLLVAAMA